jgi:nitric oxide dioxygenase
MGLATLPRRTAAPVAALTTYKFSVSQADMDRVKATLPLVANVGTDFTKHFYNRVFKAKPELLNLFNQTNQAVGKQPQKLLSTVAVAAQSAIDTGELPGEAIEGICHKHTALNLTTEHYAFLGTHLVGSIEDLLTKDPDILRAWTSLYDDLVKILQTREKELYDQMEQTPNGWLGRRSFKLVKKEKLSEVITRFKFAPVDGGDTPDFKPGMFATIWVQVEATGIHGPFKEQPRHYSLALPRKPEDRNKALSISVKREGLISGVLHDSPEGSVFELSAPYGAFDMSGVEKLWLTNNDAPVVFLSAGVGITPVLAMLENIYQTRPASWLHASLNGQMHAYRDRLRQISAVRSGQLKRRVWYSKATPEDGVAGGNEDNLDMFNLAKFHYHGRIDLTKAEKELDFFPPGILHLNNEAAQYYMCGPPGFMDAQREALKSLGVDESRIHWEGF